jgi:nickel-dependent lactate racemase
VSATNDVVSAAAPQGRVLGETEVASALASGLAGRFAGQRVLVLVPDHTRSVPLPMLARHVHACLEDAREVHFMVALGTHPPLSEERLRSLLGMDPGSPLSSDPRVRVSNHAWYEPETLTSVGVIPRDEVKAIAGARWHPTLGGDVDVLINRAVLEHDHVLILGPVFPHEVVGYSGGAKYLFPGVSGKDVIDVTHWLGALAGVRGTIGIKDTPVRALIHAAAARVPTPVTLAAVVVDGQDLAGVFVGDLVEAWSAAADLSAQRHVNWVDKPFHSILSCAPPMYDELWTAGKAMYKLEPALAEGGELIIYAPHLSEVSVVHGEHIREVGYHVLPYLLFHWDRYKHLPLGVLAHSTHVRGDGAVDPGTGDELPRAKVTLASRIPREECEALGLGYRDPASIDPEEWAGREDEGVLLVRKAGEVLYRVKER